MSYSCYRAGYGDKEIVVNASGNGTKSLHLSLEASLKKLQTSYIDLVSLFELEQGIIANKASALCSLVGFHVQYSGADAVPQYYGASRESPLSRRV